MNRLYLVILSFLLIYACNSKNVKIQYICPPCDQECDTEIFDKDGKCPHCNMNLIEYLDSTSVNDVNIHEGSGSFLVEGGLEKKDKIIRAFYHKPANFKPDSDILFVIPGAGRNGHDYRDAWMAISEAKSVLIVALQYTEDRYDFADYHLSGMVQRPATPSDETYNMNSNSAEWIFRDFDRIFKLVVSETRSKQDHYDIFGHSAGGQILHRMAIFQDFTKADRIIAVNSGWYTLPNNDFNFPYGLKDTYVNADDLSTAFEKDLTVLVGELDNADETRGHLRHTVQADAQGLHRLERAHFFINSAQEKASQLETTFDWKIQVVPEVGHDYQRMSKAAGELLYGN